VSQYELTNGFRFVIVVVSGFCMATGGVMIYEMGQDSVRQDLPPCLTNMVVGVGSNQVMVISGSPRTGEVERVVETISVQMHCSCGGEMKPSNQLLSSPAQYPHTCDKCGAGAVYPSSYPVVRYRFKE